MIHGKVCCKVPAATRGEVCCRVTIAAHGEVCCKVTAATNVEANYMCICFVSEVC